MSTAPENEVAAESLARAKPPFLRRVRIRGYKSIAFCDVTLEPLTILVGRNASGKSNFLDALAFLGNLMDMRAPEAVNERNGWRSIHCRNGSTPFIEMGISATYSSNKLTWDAEYSFALEINAQDQIRVQQEHLKLTPRYQLRECGFNYADGKFEWFGLLPLEESPASVNKTPNPEFFIRPQSDRLFLSVIGTQPFADLAERLQTSCVYSFNPSAIRVPQLITTGNPYLARDGVNLASAIKWLSHLEPKTFERIIRYLIAIVPSVKAFHIRELGDYETVHFTLESMRGEGLLEFDSSGMSDGTLRILAALVGAFQIVLKCQYPGFIGIEEPETSLHPAAMRALVDALDEATLRTQILLTTHSADMLDNPTIRPENIRVVQMIDGQTVIAPVDAASVEIVRQKLDTLGGLERQNQLEPDPEDRERQRLLSQNDSEPHQ